MAMNIQNTNQIKKQEMSIGKSIPQKSIPVVKSENASRAYVSNVYYTDLVNNKKGYNCTELVNNIPKTKSDFIKSLLISGKYSTDDINEITKMVQDIIDADEWDEVEPEILYEMFNSLAYSDINSDISTLKDITKNICKTQKDDDYINTNAVCLGVIALSNNLKANDYRFRNIYDEGYAGFLNCDNVDEVKNLVRNINTEISGVNSDKFYKLLKILNNVVNCDDDNLHQINEVINTINKYYGYKNQELLDSLIFKYNKKVPIEEIPDKINTQKILQDVYTKLNVSSKPDKLSFEQVFFASIEELLNRGYSSNDIAEFLSKENFCNRIMNIENIVFADKDILADFIEDIPKNTGHYDVMELYTEGSGVFNQPLHLTNGDLSKLPHNYKISNHNGKVYSIGEVKANINELSNLLNNQEIKRDLKVYRGGGYTVLNQKVLNDGQLLGDVLKEVADTNDIEKLEDIKKQIISEKIIQNHFMSTSYSINEARNFLKQEGGILWKINAPKGAHAIYCDPFNTENGLEREILFNKNSVLKINDIQLENGISVIDADLEIENN